MFRINNWFGNPQYLNQQIYNQHYNAIQEYQRNQDIEVMKAMDKLNDFFDSVHKLDDFHQQQLFWAVLSKVAQENNWQK